jgi:mannose-1-phosphate guanylyltransferase
MQNSEPFYAVILAGGTGTRLWPLSRQACPKQALQLVGDRTMLQHAVDRLDPLFPPERILVVTREAYLPLLIGQVPQIPTENFILEPEGRGTAPAIGLAAVHLAHRNRNSVMAVLTADHFIKDVRNFQRVLLAGYQAALEGGLVTLGIHPDAPSTGYGYIQQGELADTLEDQPVYFVERFIEKPDLPSAQRMISKGGFSWNSGMFIWRSETILNEIATYMHDLYGRLASLAAQIGTNGYEETLKSTWPLVRKETIDYGIMERAENVLVMPADIGWVDVGSWGSLEGLLPVDPDGNIWLGPHLSIDTHNTLVFGKNRLIATIGVENMIIVESGDAILIMPKDREQDVKEIVNQLAMRGEIEYL